MFVYTLSSFLDKYDRYWYGRLMALKLSMVTIVLFILNAFVKSPFSPILSMLVAGAGILLIESPMINTEQKKDTIYLFYFVLAIITIALFNLVSYFLLAFIVVTCVWCYLLYKIFSRKPEMLDIVSLLFLLGLMSIEAKPSTDGYSLFNLLMYFGEFALVAFWVHKFFPNLYFNVYKSAFLRLLECYLTILDKKQLSFCMNATLTKHLLVMRNVMPLLKSKMEFKKIECILATIEELHDLLRMRDIFACSDHAEMRYLLHQISIILKNDGTADTIFLTYFQPGLLYEQLILLQMRWGELCKKN